MEAYAIVIAGHEVSEQGYTNLEASSKKVKNSFEIKKFDAIIPKMARTVMSGNGIRWKYPWEGQETDIKTGLIKSAYPTANRNTRIACALSHWLLWHKCLTKDEPLLILEHDALFVAKLDYDKIINSKYDIVGINSPAAATRKAHEFHDKVQATHALIQPVPTIDEFNVACPEMSFFFSWRYDGIYVGRSGVSVCDGSDYKRIITLNNVKDKWHTVLLNINWTDQEDGKIKLWLNDQLIYRFEGKTISKIVKNKNEYQMGPKFRFGLYSQGENGDQVMHYEGMKAEKSCNKLQLFDCNYIQKQEIDVVKTNPADPDDGNQIVGQYETNDDQGKRDRIINTLINKITKDISKKSNSNKDDIKTWVATEVNKLDWDKDLDKSKDRKKIRDQLTKKGKKTFK